MAAVKLYNIAKMTTATVGTGTITLGAAVSGFLTFALAGVADGETVRYGIRDGANTEVGYGVYTAAGTTLTRVPQKSTNGDAAISLSGTAIVYIEALAADYPWVMDSGGASATTAVVTWNFPSGAVLNFGASDVTLTHAANLLTLAGGDLAVPDEVYDATGWDGDLTVPTKNAVRDKIEAMGAGSGDVVGPASATDNAATRFDTTTGKLVQNSALIIADTTGAISRSGGGGIQQQGTNTNDNAAAGEVGEFVNSSVANTSAVSLTTNVAANVTSISLTAGDWDVYGMVAYKAGATTTCTFGLGVISDTSGSVSQLNTGIGTLRVDGWGSQNSTVAGFVPDPSILPPTRFSLSATTTIYLVAFATFAVSTMGAYGYISARRVR